MKIIADDYGLGEGHDRVMRELLAARAIDGVSVLVETCTPASAEALLAGLKPGQEIGLHFNLTLGARQPKREILLLTSLARRKWAAAALKMQLATFEKMFARGPDFIDGHEHVHAFPGVVPAVIAEASRRGIWVRSTVPQRSPHDLKSRVLAALGRRTQTLARAAGVRTNAHFAGILPLGRPEEALALLARDLAEATPETLVMVHPGAESDPASVSGHSNSLRAREANLLISRAATGA